MPSLPLELAVSAGLFVLTSLFHLVGLDLVLRGTRWHLEHALSGRLALDRVAVPMGMTLGLFVVHGVEVLAYAAVFRAVDASADWSAAVAASLAAYSTSGPIILNGWNVVGSGESLNGIVLLGWSTAFLFQHLHRITTAPDDPSLPQGAIARRRKPLP